MIAADSRKIDAYQAGCLTDQIALKDIFLMSGLSRNQIGRSALEDNVTSVVANRINHRVEVATPAAGAGNANSDSLASHQVPYEDVAIVAVADAVDEIRCRVIKGDVPPIWRDMGQAGPAPVGPVRAGRINR